MNVPLNSQKFQNPYVTAKGEQRARVAFTQLETLWFNTGSLCNIECENCYILSSPKADHFLYLTPQDMVPYLDEVDHLCDLPIEMAFTGGEPYMNPHIITLLTMALERGHHVLVLTNAMKPLMRPRVQNGLLALQKRYKDKITMRVSLDHFTAPAHDEERGRGSFCRALQGMDWLTRHGFILHIAGRAMFSESEQVSRAGYQCLIEAQGWSVDAYDQKQLILFPEMDEREDVPEITTACWESLGVQAEHMMCASSRMVVRRKGADGTVVLPCTLLWDGVQFELGASLVNARKDIMLNHPHCAKFCVLGGASCSA